MSSASSLRKRPVFAKPHHFTRTWDGDGWICNVCQPNDSSTILSMTTQAAVDHEETPQHSRQVDAIKDPPRDGRTPFETQMLTSKSLKGMEYGWRIDHVRDVVPWWVRGVEAAERGEVWKMEDLLDSIPDDPWQDPKEDIWGGGWGGGKDPHNQNDWADDWGGEDGWGDGGGNEGWGTGAGAESSWDHGQAQRGWDMTGSPSSLCAPRTMTASSAERTRKRREKILKRVGQNKAWRGVDDRDTRSQGHMHRFVEDIAEREAADDGRRRRMHMFLEMSTQEKIQKIQETIRYLHGRQAPQ